MNNSRFVSIPKILDRRGYLAFIENDKDLPFKISRTCWIFDMQVGAAYGDYACKHNEDFVVALSGSIDVVIENGTAKEKHNLDRPHFGLYIPRMFWRRFEKARSDTVVMILCSDLFDENDYIREYDRFISLAGCGGSF